MMVMNITEKIIASEEDRTKYFDKLKELESMANSFAEHTKRIQENAKKKEKAEPKKRKAKDVLVTEATSKSDIRRLMRTLRQKIAEVISEDGTDQKTKTIRVNGLQNKLNALIRILNDIEEAEQEALEEKRKKKGKESVRLSGDDLTVNKKGSSSQIDVSVSSMSPKVSAPGGSLVSSFEAAINSQAAAAPQTIDASV
jgi:chromosome segregation ATPase